MDSTGICNKNRQLSLRIDESDKSTGENSQNIRERSISEGYGERITAGYGERSTAGGYGERLTAGGYGERSTAGGYGER